MLNIKEVQALYERLEELYQEDLDVKDMDHEKYYRGLEDFVRVAGQQIRLEVMYHRFTAQGH